MAYDKVVDASKLDANLTSVADAIRTKSGTTGKLTFPDGFVSAVEEIQTESSPVIQPISITENGTYEAPDGVDGYSPVLVNVPTSGGTTAPASGPNDVNFTDYDGTILYSYSLEEAQALTELPALPSHNGLICQGWNWALDAIKALGRAVTVGVNYITDDGATRLHIRIATGGRMTVPLHFGQTTGNGVSIDWGDGTAAETLAGTGYVNTSHTYAQPGNYVISLLPEDGCTLSLGNGSSTYCVLGATASAGCVYTNMLQTAHIGKNVTSIGTYAFYYCYSLASITLPESVTSIGSSAFLSCYSLASITIPEGVTSIGSSAFLSCYSLASITIPESVTSIGSSAFLSCGSLASITIPEGVTSIGSSAFKYCYSLASITIPESMTSIGDSAFSNCSSLASITLPESVTSIGSYAFYNCSSLASITIPESVTSIGSYAFRNCYSLASITIPESVTSIGSYAFYNCYSLASITLPESVTSIGNSAFYNCYSLASITIPESVTSIGNSAFYNCYSLASITIPESVTSIGDYAFSNCYGMRYYDFTACTSVPALPDKNAFSNIPSDCQMLIPAALYDEWSAATNWVTYASYMVGV